MQQKNAAKNYYHRFCQQKYGPCCWKAVDLQQKYVDVANM
jgi:hypothetical protein